MIEAAITGALVTMIISGLIALNNKLKTDAETRKGIRQDAVVDLLCTMTEGQDK